MLVLTRKPRADDGSVITIGNTIEVAVLEVQGDSVRLGITAPKETPVHRCEVWHQIKAEGRPRDQDLPERNHKPPSAG